MSHAHRILVLAGLVAGVAAWRSLGELRFVVAGAEAVARPIAVQREVRKAGGEPTGRFRVQYVFQAGQEAVEGSVLVGEAEMERLQTAGRIPLRYLSSEPSRQVLVGHREVVWPGILLAALAVVLASGWRLWRASRPGGA